MRKVKDWKGERFGRLVAVEMVERDQKWRDHKWRFRCDCGGEAITGIKQAKSGHTKSCGCLFREAMVARNTRHGLSRKHPIEYRIWKNMRGRCNTPTDSDYADYGGRGIRICDRWTDFAAFFEDMGQRPEGHSLDREDVNGDYDPSNCRWATDKQQANNKRSNYLIEHGGVTRTLMQWCEIYGLDHSKVWYRLKTGRSFEEAFSRHDLRKPRNGEIGATA